MKRSFGGGDVAVEKRTKLEPTVKVEHAQQGAGVALPLVLGKPSPGTAPQLKLKAMGLEQQESEADRQRQLELAAEEAERAQRDKELDAMVGAISDIIKSSSTKMDTDKNENLSTKLVSKYIEPVKRVTLLSFLRTFAGRPRGLWDIPEWFKTEFLALNCIYDAKATNNVSVEDIVCRAVAWLQSDDPEDWGWFGKLIVDNDWMESARKSRKEHKQKRLERTNKATLRCKQCGRSNIRNSVRTGEIICHDCGTVQDGQILLKSRVITDDGDVNLETTGRPMDIFLTTTTQMTPVVAGGNDHSKQMSAAHRRVVVNYMKSETGSVGLHTREKQKQKSYQLIDEIGRGMKFDNLDAVTHIAKFAFKAYRESQSKLMKRLAVIVACVVTGYDFVRLHLKETSDPDASKPMSYECEDFWAWESSTIKSDRDADRHVGFYSSDDVGRWNRDSKESDRFRSHWIPFDKATTADIEKAIDSANGPIVQVAGVPFAIRCDPRSKGSGTMVQSGATSAASGFVLNVSLDQIILNLRKSSSLDLKQVNVQFAVVPRRKQMATAGAAEAPEKSLFGPTVNGYTISKLRLKVPKPPAKVYQWRPDQPIRLVMMGRHSLEGHDFVVRLFSRANLDRPVGHGQIPMSKLLSNFEAKKVNAVAIRVVDSKLNVLPKSTLGRIVVGKWVSKVRRERCCLSAPFRSEGDLLKHQETHHLNNMAP